MAEVTVNAAAHPSFDRAHGATKIGVRRCLSLGQRLTIMAGGNVSTRTAARFAAVGVLGLGVDYAIFEASTALGLPLLAAQVSSFLCAMLLNYALNSRWTFSNYSARSAEAEWRICGRFVTISLMAFFLSAGILQLALEVWNWPQVAAASLVSRRGRSSTISAAPSMYFLWLAGGFHQRSDGALRPLACPSMQFFCGSFTCAR